MLAHFGPIKLTKDRVRSEAYSEFGSALLSEVNAVTVSQKSSPAFILLSAILAVGGYVASKSAHETGFLVFGIGAAVVCAILYFVTRKTLLTVHAGSAAISVELTGHGMQMAEVFIDAVEDAKRRLEAPRVAAIAPAPLVPQRPGEHRF